MGDTSSLSDPLGPPLARAVTHGRELVPPPDMLPRTRRKDDFLRWSDTERIPTDQMVDCSKCQEELWEKLSDFLQDTWGTLASAFMTARTKDEFIQDVSLSALLPIRVALGNLSTTSPVSASGTIIH